MTESGGDGEQAPLEAFYRRLREVVTPIDRTETLPVSTAVGRPLAEPVVARRPVPQFDQVTRDGFAVSAAALSGATDDEPVSFAIGEGGDGERAVRVDAGQALPPGTDAVVSVDAVRDPDSTLGAESEGGDAGSRDPQFTEPVETGAGVRPAGADVSEGETVRPAGHGLTESDPALCTAVGQTRVDVFQRPTVGVVPTGSGVVGGDPGPETVVETNGTTISEFVERWGGKVTYRDPVSTDRHALRPAVERDLTKDLIVTVGGTGDGEADRIGEVLEGLGEVQVDGLALEPGGGASLSVVRERPVISLPGDPVAAFVTATLLVGPAVTRLAGRDPPMAQNFDAELSATISSESGLVSVAPVEAPDPVAPAIEDRLGAVERAGEPAASSPIVRPVDDDPYSTLARADGWVIVPDARDQISAGETVAVERWEHSS